MRRSGLYAAALIFVMLRPVPGLPISRGWLQEPFSKVVIHWQTELDMFPAEWRQAPVNAFALPAENVQDQLDAILRAIAKYPPVLVRRHLSRVYLMRRLVFYGLDYGGTYSNDRIYIVSDPQQPELAEASFHHEFSSILMKNEAGRFPRAAWMRALPVQSSYRHGGLAALRRGETGLAWMPQFHLQGFLCEYGKASFEEDVNTFAEALFTGQGLFRLARMYPLVLQKKQLLIDFYSSMDPSLNRTFFQGIEIRRSSLAVQPAGLEVYTFRNGTLRQRTHTEWRAALHSGAAYLFQLSGRDRHYVYLTDTTRNVYIGLPLNNDKNWLYRFIPEGTGYIHQRLDFIP
jgi:hypothetical protein